MLKYVLVILSALELSFHCCFACSRAFVTTVVTKFVCTQAFCFFFREKERQSGSRKWWGHTPLQLLSVIKSSMTFHTEIKGHSLWKWKKIKVSVQSSWDHGSWPQADLGSYSCFFFNPCVTLDKFPKPSKHQLSHL